jgi:hypothetical protein
MAYDDKNHYPAIPVIPEKQSASRGVSAAQNLKDRALGMLKACSKDMQWLETERKRFTQFYNAEKLGNEIKGRSQVVMSDVADTIETLMPYLMDMFYGGKNVMSCRPQGPEDEIKSSLMEEKVNFDIQHGLDGFKLLYNFFKDSLIHKMGIIKYYWLREKRYRRCKFKDLTNDEYMALITSGAYEIDDVKSNINYYDGRTIGVDNNPDIELFEGEEIKHTVKCREVIQTSKPFAENLPPEEFIFDYKARDLNCAFKAHKKRVHKNYVKSEYNITDEDLNNTIEEFYDNASVIERFRDLGGSLFISDEKDSQFVYIYECYIDDYDSKGREVPKIVTILGQEIIREADNQEGAGFVVVSPVLVPHRVCGKGIAETTMEIQKLRTALVRFVLDTIYFSTSGRTVVNPYRIDYDSVITSNRPGGVAVTKFDINPSEGIFPMPVATMPPYVMKMMEYVEMMRENRTGVARYVGGIDPNSLNRTATGITTIMNAAQQRIKLIARIFAETGVRDLYQAFVDMNIRFFDMGQSIKVNKEWVQIQPADIDGKFDVIIDVGANSGIKEQKFQQKLQMLQMYGMMGKMMGPQVLAIFNMENIRNIIRSMWEDLDFKNVDEFVAPEGTQPPMMPPPGGVNAGGAGQNQVQGGGGPQGVGQPPNQGVLQGPGGVPA